MIEAFEGGHSSDYVRALVDARLIANASYGKGFPVVRSGALDIFEQLSTRFVEAIGRGQPVFRNRPPLLISEDIYDGEVEALGGFDATYRLTIDSSRVVMRPDSAVDNLRAARAASIDGGASQVFSVVQGFRAVKGSTVPFFRDRFIFPFIQFNRLSPRADRDEETQAHWAAIGQFFDALALPTRIIDFGVWKNYARRLYAVVAHLPSGRPTIVAMMFVVGDILCGLAGVPDDMDAVDIGITEKVLGMTVLRHADDRGIRLPSCIAPIQLGMSTEARAMLPYEALKRLECLRTSVLGDQASWSADTWSHRGVPLLLQRGYTGLRLLRRSAEWTDITAGYDFHAALRAEDSALWDMATITDLTVAEPPLLEVQSSGSTAMPGAAVGSVVFVSQRLRDQFPGKSFATAWSGDRVFY